MNTIIQYVHLSFLIQYGFKTYIDMVEDMNYKEWIDVFRNGNRKVCVVKK